MTIAINPRDLEKVSKAIAGRFDYDALDIILFKCSGDSIINAIANREWERDRIARACLEATQRDGTLLTFLSFLIEARPEEEHFRALIYEIVPAVAQARPETKAAVDLVVKELYRVRTFMADPAVRAAMETSRTALGALIDAVRTLRAYKTLHDTLHQIQIRRQPGLRGDARGLANDEASLYRLREFHDHIRHSHALALAAVNEFPSNDVARTYEQGWIDRLGTFATALEEAMDHRDPAKSLLALGVVLKIVEVEPSQLNGKIFAVAKQLPLLALVSALEQVAAAAPDNRPFEEATAALRALRATLTARVAEHDLWQKADDELTEIDRLQPLPVEQRMIDFILLWPQVRNRINSLAYSREGAVWARKLLEYGARVDDDLLPVEAVLGEGKLETEHAGLAGSLEERYGMFRREARWLFFRVDQDLKADCTALMEIGAPIEALLDELSHG